MQFLAQKVPCLGRCWRRLILCLVNLFPSYVTLAVSADRILARNNQIKGLDSPDIADKGLFY